MSRPSNKGRVGFEHDDMTKVSGAPALEDDAPPKKQPRRKPVKRIEYVSAAPSHRAFIDAWNAQLEAEARAAAVARAATIPEAPELPAAKPARPYVGLRPADGVAFVDAETRRASLERWDEKPMFGPES
jgi:hypothetical protein